MDINTGCVHVLGTGHLAAAVRVQLRFGWRPERLTRQRGTVGGPSGDVWWSPRDRVSTGGDCEHTCGASGLFLACADFECAPSFADANRRALAARSPLLFACLAERAVKVGPWVVPFETACFECHPAQRWDFSPSELERRVISAAGDVPLDSRVDIDAYLEWLAQFGSAHIARLIGPFVSRPGAQLPRLAGCVAKFDPPSPEPRHLPWPRAPHCPACGSPGFRPGPGQG
jgi:hypothetical protein